MVTVEGMPTGLPLERLREPIYRALLPLPPVETRLTVRMGAAMVAQTTLLVAAMSLLR